MDIAVSVIVPIYNVENYLSRCMDSLLNQTLKNIEIILVDDESPDNCPKLCDMYAKDDSRIKVIHKKNGGLGMARNSGLEIATGKYVAYLDSDDFVALDMYEKLYRFAEENNLDTVISGFYRYINDDTIIERRETEENIIAEGQNAIHQFVMDMIGAPANCHKDYKFEMSVWRGIYSSKIIKENNIRFPSERKYISEDIVYHMDYFEHSFRLGIMGEAFYYYCENETSLTKTYRADRFQKNVELYEYILGKFKDYSYPKEAKEYADRMLLARGRTAVRQIIENSKQLGRKESKIEINKVTENSVYSNIVKNYDVNQLPIQQKIFIKFLNARLYFGLAVIVKLNDMRKNNK